MNALEDELLPLFEDHVEKAECLLEEACLDASSMVRDKNFATELGDLASASAAPANAGKKSPPPNPKKSPL